MDFEIIYNFNDPSQFWDELRDVVSAPSECSEAETGTSVRQYIQLVGSYKDNFLTTDSDFETCVKIFRNSEFFKFNSESIHTWLARELQDDTADVFVRAFAAHLLVCEGTSGTGERLLKRLLQDGLLRWAIAAYTASSDTFFSLTLTRLMYEMTRIQPVDAGELKAIETDFLKKIVKDSIEEYHALDFAVSDDRDGRDGAYYCLGLLLVLNEQYLYYNSQAQEPITNRVIVYLAHCGEFNHLTPCIVRRLNRETRPDKQNLLLQLLYSIFHYGETAEGLYTTDLHVLIDILIRNLFDLPYESTDTYNVRLRHLHLRVLHLLFERSQLGEDGVPYKPGEVYKVLRYLIGERQAVSDLGFGSGSGVLSEPAAAVAVAAPEVRAKAPPTPPPPPAVPDPIPKDRTDSPFRDGVGSDSPSSVVGVGLPPPPVPRARGGAGAAPPLVTVSHPMGRSPARPDSPQCANGGSFQQQHQQHQQQSLGATGWVPPLPPPRRGGANRARLKPPPPPPPRSRSSRSRSPVPGGGGGTNGTSNVTTDGTTNGVANGASVESASLSLAPGPGVVPDRRDGVPQLANGGATNGAGDKVIGDGTNGSRHGHGHGHGDRTGGDVMNGDGESHHPGWAADKPAGCLHFQPFDDKTRELAGRCWDAYVAVFPQLKG